MDYIFNMHDGRRLVFYTDGNDINMIICGPGRNTKFTKLENDFHSSLKAIYHDGEIYYAYISYARELVVETVISENRIVVFQDSSDILNIRNLSLQVVQGKIYLFCVLNLNDRETVIRYYEVYGDKSSRDLIVSKTISAYDVFEMNEHKMLWFSTKTREHKFYQILSNDRGEIALEEVLIDSKRNVTNKEENLKKQKDEIEEKLKNNFEERMKLEIEKQQKTFKKKYEQLAEATKEIQNEGKKWRELYYENVNK